MTAPLTTPPPPELLARFAALVGPAHACSEPERKASFLTEPRGLYQGRSPMILQPGSREQVAAIMMLANTSGTSIVPQGGNTGLVGGQIPDESGSQIVLSLARLNRIREIDVEGNMLTAEAGVTLQSVQQAAEAADRLFPLSLASEGSCQIGGNIASNAGGTAVLAYGNMRDLVLGLEVVLPSGEIWNGLRKLRKDNTGYDLKHLFIGSEGTLGIVTAAVLKLSARPKGKSVSLAGLASPEAMLRLFSLARATAGTGLTACEFTARFGIDLLRAHAPAISDPLGKRHEWYVLLEISSPHSQQDADRLSEAVLSAALGEGIIEDAVIARSLQQAAEIWKIRHSLSEVQRREGGSIKHDVSVPLAAIPSLIRQGSELAKKIVPLCRPFPFGHLGDGNVHFNISQPIGMEREMFLGHWQAMNEAIHALIVSLGGSISAEHGIGRLKREALTLVKSPVELALMRAVKMAIDPKGLLNPGKLL